MAIVIKSIIYPSFSIFCFVRGGVDVYDVTNISFIGTFRASGMNWEQVDLDHDPDSVANLAIT